MPEPKNQTQAADGQVLSKSRHERVLADEHGQRIDNFLIKKCRGVPRSHVYRMIRTGDVRVDGRRIKQTRKLKEGEQVRIPAIREAAQTNKRVPDKLLAAVKSSVILEHEDFIVVNKPAGLAVHGGSGLDFGLIDALRQSLHEPGLDLAHRLDRATSGCLLIGRGLKNTRQLQDLFRQRTIKKRYLALVDGHWPKTLSRVDVPLLKNAEHSGERRVLVHPDGQRSLTRFAVVERFPSATLLDVELETGRTHQIRVHTCHSGYAVIGDTRYGNNQVNTRYRKSGLGRLFLHSSELAFDWGNTHHHIVAPVDETWNVSMQTLRMMEP